MTGTGGRKCPSGEGNGSGNDFLQRRKQEETPIDGAGIRHDLPQARLVGTDRYCGRFPASRSNSHFMTSTMVTAEPGMTRHQKTMVPGPTLTS